MALASLKSLLKLPNPTKLKEFARIRLHDVEEKTNNSTTGIIVNRMRINIAGDMKAK
jgi:hypothetical protein